MPPGVIPRWRLDVLSPVDAAILWCYEGPTTKDILEQWNVDTDNSPYITLQRLNRCSLGRSKNPLIQLYKIGDFAEKSKEIV